MARTAPSPVHVDRTDALLAAVALVATTLYLAALPRNLGQSDESIYLYEARRILEGAVPYRDFFEIVPPGWMLVMAGLFSVFGTDLATARIAAAVMHGLTAALLYLTCRRLGVRRGLSWPVPLVYLVVCQPAWPVASQHWLGTLLCAMLLYLCAGGPSRRATWAIGPGVVVGLLVAVHQQRGVLVGLGVAVWLVVDQALRRSYRVPGPRLVSQLAWLIGGVLLVTLPLGVYLIAGAGVGPVGRALVLHPLFNYHLENRTRWGEVHLFSAHQAAQTFPRLLAWLPAALAVPLLRLASLLRRWQDPDGARGLTLLLVFGAFSLLSIAYNRDFIHIAFIAPVFFVTIAESAEWAVRRVGGATPALRACGAVAGAALLVAAVAQLGSNLRQGRETFRLTRQTAFGRVDLAHPIEAELYDRLAELMPAVSSRELFCYPIISHLYLMVNARNPTPYLFVIPGYTDPDQVQEIVDVLAARKLPYIVALKGFTRPDDPIMGWIEKHYEPLAATGAKSAIYRRRAFVSDESPAQQGAQ